MLPTTLRLTLESVVNRVIRHDPAARERLARLAGHVIAVELEHPHLHLQLTPTAEGLLWRNDPELPPDATIRGSLPTLLATLSDAHPRDALFTRVLTIDGDESVATRLLRILAGLDIDWAGWLAEAIGPSAAGLVEQAAARLHRGAEEWRETRRIEQHDFLVHEARLVVDDIDLPGFLDAVDETRAAVERLERRIHVLEQPLEQPPEDDTAAKED
jgi:ubiquinone biosynthesis protein UbiJ